MKFNFPGSYPMGSPEQQVAQKREQQIQVTVLGGYFATMFALAFGLPEKFQNMQWIMPMIEWSRLWVPNITLVAARAQQPELVEAYLILGIVFWLPTFAGYVALRPHGRTLVPLDSWVPKILGLIMFPLFVLVMSAFWWNPIVSEFKMGAWEGRFGAMMAAALSGRFGMAVLLNLFFCLGPLIFTIVIWMGITKPVKRPVDFTQS